MSVFRYTHLAVLAKVLPAYPDITAEINISYGLVDIVAERFDAGVRSGNQVARDMIAVRIAPDQRTLVVGSPDYLARHPAPKNPRDLAGHDCINLRLPTYGGLYVWEVVNDGQAVQVQVKGQFIVNTTPIMLRAALAGPGLAYLPEDSVHEPIARGRLKPVLKDWWPTFPGDHLYYPSRRQTSPAFTVVLNALRHPS